MKAREAVEALLDAFLEDAPRCACLKLATHNIERANHWGWVCCDEHIPTDDGATLYEMDTADAVRRLGLTTSTAGADLLEMLDALADATGKL